MRSHGAHPPSLTWKALVTRWQRGLVGLAAFLLIAQLLGSSGVLSRSVLPLASTVLARAAGLVGNPQFLTDLAVTLEAWAAGLAIAVAVAVPSGLILGNVPGVRSATRALVEFLRPIPAVVLIPLAALLLGPGLRMNVTLIVYAAAWPVLLNTIYGLDDVDPLAKETLRTFGFGRIAVIRRVCLPSAAPFIVTGIRLASSVAIVVSIGIGVVTGRIDGNGIGAFIADAGTYRYDSPQQWWDTCLSEGPWLTWRHIPVPRLAQARAKALALAGDLREPDGSLVRHIRMAYLVAHRPEGG